MKKTNIGKKYNSMNKVLTDMKGHEVFRLYIRKNRGATTISLPFFYCVKCQLFYKAELVEQQMR